MAASTPVISIDSSPAALQSQLPASTHRLPTISASEALQGLRSDDSASVATGLSDLDKYLAGGACVNGGIERGKTTEVWGPIGVGKTAILLQVAANELHRGHKVLWIDAGGGCCPKRMRSALAHRSLSAASRPVTGATRTRYMSNFTLLTMPTLSHLLALLLHTKPDFPAEKTSLLVIDGFNMLIDVDYPRVLFNSAGKTEQQKWQAGRRYAILGTLITTLNKLATLKDFAALVTTGCASRTRSDSGLGSALVPGIGGQEWDSGIWNRLAVFRDFSSRFVGVQKLRGRSIISREEIGEAGKLFAFDIGPTGHISQQTAGENAMPSDIAKKVLRSPVKARKRRFDEVADSEDEEADEYGWANTDEDAFADATHGDPGAGPVG